MIIVRPATDTDLPELSHIWYEKMVLQQQSDNHFALISGARSKWIEAATLWLRDYNCVIRVAESNGILLGYAVGWVQDAPPGLLPEKLGAITDMMVDTHSTQKGVGRLLLESLREWFASRGIQQLTAIV